MPYTILGCHNSQHYTLIKFKFKDQFDKDGQIPKLI